MNSTNLKQETKSCFKERGNELVNNFKEREKQLVNKGHWIDPTSLNKVIERVNWISLLADDGIITEPTFDKATDKIQTLFSDVVFASNTVVVQDELYLVVTKKGKKELVKVDNAKSHELLTGSHVLTAPKKREVNNAHNSNKSVVTPKFSQKKSLTTKILNFMQLHPETSFTPNDIQVKGNFKGKHVDSIRTNLYALYSRGLVIKSAEKTKTATGHTFSWQLAPAKAQNTTPVEDNTPVIVLA